MKVNIGKYPGPKSKKDRKVSVRIDYYDVWSLDHTLAIIIHPALLKLAEHKHGSPYVPDEEVPEHLRRSSAPPVKNDWETDENFHKRWDWVLQEMIWAFGQEIAEPHWEEQFHSGTHDIQFKDNGDGTSTMVRGPRDTHGFDKEGWKAHSARMENGFRLFGLFYRNLWD